MARHWWRGTTSVAVGVVAVAALAMPAPAAVESSTTYRYDVQLAFTQLGEWTYEGLLAATPCTRADSGFGSDKVRLGAGAPFAPGRGGRNGVAVLSAAGQHERVGTMTHTVSGGECATAGTTETESIAGCGSKDTLRYAKVTLSGRKLTLRWDRSMSAPQFGCPYFGGNDDAAPGQELPGDAYLDATITFDPTPLTRGVKKVVVAKRVVRHGIQDCASLLQGCSEGVSFRATGNSEARVLLYFIRRH
jgi:hypothetical protein